MIQEAPHLQNDETDQGQIIAVGLPGPDFAVTRTTQGDQPGPSDLPEESDEYTERRRFVRVTTRVTLELIHQDQPVEATLVDLSEGGVRCVLEPGQEINPDEIIRARIELGDDELQVEGQISWLNLDDGSCEMGIRFVGLNDSEAQWVRSRVFAIQLEQRRLERR